MLAIEAGGIAALIVGTVAVARSSAFGGLRKISKITDILPGSDSAGSAGGSPDQPAPATADPSPAQNSAEPTHVHPVAQPDPASSPAQRLSRALVTRRQAPGQASGGDGG